MVTDGKAVGLLEKGRKRKRKRRREKEEEAKHGGGGCGEFWDAKVANEELRVSQFWLATIIYIYKKIKLNVQNALTYSREILRKPLSFTGFYI